METQAFIKFSMCDMLKQGIGSSSSHTLAPWLAARDCYGKIKDDLQYLGAVEVELFGSLAYVGRGHYTTIALPLGLLNKDPKTFDISADLKGTLGIDDITNIQNLELLNYESGPSVRYSVRYNTSLNLDPEKMVFHFTWLVAGAEDRVSARPDSLTYYSYGGGSYGQEEPPPPPLYQDMDKWSYMYNGADKLLSLLSGQSLSDAIFKNEVDFAKYRAEHSKDPLYKNLPMKESDIIPYLKGIAVQMGKLIFGGFTYDDNDKCYKVMYASKKAKQIYHRLFVGEAAPAEDLDWSHFLRLIRARAKNFGFDKIMKLVGAFALAVAEQNAALKNVVTAPTNGACGVVPAVLYYYVLFHASEEETSWLFDDNSQETSTVELNNICKFLLVANAVGGIVKANANIAGGLGGCQAEIGTASAMAAGALTEVLGGGAPKVFQAAEAALEAHLGSICDPIGGLVEIPCIERNLTAAITAIAASCELLALEPGFATVVPFDKVVETMENISKKMDRAYKETSTGGLAKTMQESVRAKRPDLFPENAVPVEGGRISVSRTTC